MDDPLPPDVINRLNEDFGERADAVASLLLARRRTGSADYLSDRLVRCIVCGSLGDEQRVKELLAFEDYRDIIMAGEYDEAMGHVRDLSATFLIDTPEKFWVSEVTHVMSTRGYQLASLETRPATTGPFAYGADYGEGRATFIGPKGKIEIEKKDRQWRIHLNPRELDIHDLNHAFSDERTFRDAVWGYLLSNVAVNAVHETNEVPQAQNRWRRWWRFWK